MEISVIVGILFIHWVADFILQTDAQAKGKSTSNSCLLLHTITYSQFIWACAAIYCQANGISVLQSMYVFFVTLIAHTVTDYFTSRLNSYLWKKGDSHNFFVSVGFDQILHYVQLFLTFKYFLC